MPGVVDAHVHQVMNGPDLHLEVDRTRAAQFGLTQLDVSNSLFVSLSSSAQVQPNFWLDPKMGITYAVAAQTPQYRLDTVAAMENTPIAVRTGGPPQLLSNVASVSHSITPVVANHRNVQPVFDVYANVQNSDLGSVAGKIERIVERFRKQLAPGSEIVVRGQVESMQEAFTRLGIGLAFAAILVYLLMVVNFQSWTDPFIIITALPGAFTGIVWILFMTQTTFSVPVADGGHHEHRGGDRQLDPAGDLCERTDGIGADGAAGGRGCGLYAASSDMHDRPGDDHRHAAYGARVRRRRRAECSPGARRDRRAGGGDIRHAVLCAADVQRPSFAKDQLGGDHFVTPSIQSESVAGTGRKRNSTLRYAGAALLLALLIFAGVWPRMGRNREAVAIAKAAGVSLPSVLVTKAESASPNSELLLPGNTEAVNVASIFARANGYVRERMVDIGSMVKGGQTLAVIESPEVDQELAQARAALEQTRAALEQTTANLEQAKAGVNQATANVEQARANEEIAATTDQRWSRLVERGVIPAAIGRRAAQRVPGQEGGIGGGARRTSVPPRPAWFRGLRISGRPARTSKHRRPMFAGCRSCRASSGSLRHSTVWSPSAKIERGDLVTAGTGGGRNLFTVAQAKRCASR